MACNIPDELEAHYYRPVNPFVYNETLTLNDAVTYTVYSLLLISFVMYLVYILIKGNRSVKVSMKADKPLLTFLKILSGSFWILGVLQEAGFARLLCPSLVTCNVRFAVEYFFGFHLWICTFLYRMIRLHAVLRGSKPFKASSLLLLLMLFPFAIVASKSALKGSYAASFFYEQVRLFEGQKSVPFGISWCTTNGEWFFAFDSLEVLYFVFFLFFAFSLWAYVNHSFPEMRDSILFCHFSFIAFFACRCLFYFRVEQSVFGRLFSLGIVFLVVVCHLWMLLLKLIRTNAQAVKKERKFSDLVDQKPKEEEKKQVEPELTETSDVVVDISQKSAPLTPQPRRLSIVEKMRTWVSSSRVNLQEYPIVDESNLDFNLSRRARKAEDEQVDLQYKEFIERLPEGEYEKVQVEAFFPQKFNLISVTQKDIEKAFELLTEQAIAVRNVTLMGEP